LDSTLAEGYAALGNVDKGWTHDWNAAELHYRRALDLNENYAAGHLWYAILLAWTGRVHDASWEINKAQELDPLSPITQVTVARIAYLNHDYGRACREYRQAIELDPQNASPWFGLSVSCYQQGLLEDAAGAWEQGVQQLPESLGIAPGKPASRSRSAYLARRLHTMRILAQHGHASAAELAAAEAADGHRSRAFDLLHRASLDNSLVLGDLQNLPEYEGLRSDPRYAILIARLKAS
jgi:tetratricopeptide (TPR) repeat protein